MTTSFRKLLDKEDEYKQLYRWCQNKYVYEWFEQRILSYEEIVNKYKNKLKSNKQELLIIKYDNKDIGLVQIYKYEDKINDLNNTYEFDIYIGEEEYLNKGIGTLIINEVNKYIYSKYNADSIILRPFKRNIRAIKCYLKCGFKIINEYEGFNTLKEKEIIIVLLHNKYRK